jgi:signal transduction histidine kinase
MAGEHGTVGPGPEGPKRMPARRPAAGSRRALWAGFAAATGAVVVLLLLQYRFLRELERSTTVARRATLVKLLDVVSKEAFSELRAASEPVFLMSAADLSDEGLASLGARLGCPREGARRLFVFSLRAKHPLHFQDPKARSLVVPDYSDETLAVWSATAPWTLVAKRGVTADGRRVHSDERDPHNRILMKAITDRDSRIVGLAGIILDDDYFAREALPRAIRSTLSSFPNGDDLAVFVWNERGEPVLPGSRRPPKDKSLVSRSLAAPFSDWFIAVQDRRSTPERLASRNFALNMTLSATLALLLLGAILLTTRAGAREIRLSAMKSDFVSNVSHELRTPLASIRVFGELMRTGRVTSAEKVHEYGELIETEARRLGHLVENILDFSRIESGRKSYTFQEADLCEVVRASVEAFAVRVRSAGFEIALYCPDPPLPRMRLDPGAIDQALCNVLDNAVKYSGDGHDIRVSVERRGEEAVVSVRDRGVGIPKDELGRIFERFHRVGAGLVHDVRGAGLGLAIVRHIVQAHDGRIEVESELGVGSTFSIVLPLAVTPEASTTHAGG